MRGFRNIIIATLIALAGGSCFEPPDYSNVPQIEFEDMVYKRVGTMDSLIFFISFKDGDGDLGIGVSEKGCFLDGDENLICFQNKIHELYQNSAGEYGIVDTGTACSGTSNCYTEKFFILKPDRSLISYEDKRTDPNYASLPSFEKPFNCVTWQRIFDENNIVTDTVFVQRNSDHNNFEIDFLVKNPDGITFTEFDFTKEYDFPNCGISFDGRFPILFSDRPGSPLEGVLRFRIGSPFLKTQFSLKTLKFRIQIKDRALNRSNTIETPEIAF
jgi:hypothetical protein